MPTQFYCATCDTFVGSVDCPNPNHAAPHKLISGPQVATDTIVEYRGRIVLILRAKSGESEEGKWALPGGYMNYRERCVDSAVREAREETGLDLASVTLFGVYDDPRRDMRNDRNTIAIVYTGVGIGELHREDEDGEVSAVRGFSREEIEDRCFSPLHRGAEHPCVAVGGNLDPERFLSGGFELAFDHDRILRDYFASRHGL